MDRESLLYKYGLTVIEDSGWPPVRSYPQTVPDGDSQQLFVEGEIKKPERSYCAINRCDLWCRDSGSPQASAEIILQAAKGDRDAALHVSWCPDCQKVAQDLDRQKSNQVKRAYAMYRAGVQDPDCSHHPSRTHEQNVDMALLENDLDAKKIIEICLGCQIRVWQINDG